MRIGMLGFASALGCSLVFELTFAQTIVNVDQPIKTSARNPDAVAVVIGITNYQHPDLPKVEFARRDAETIKRLLVDTFGYRDYRVLLREDDAVSLGRIKPLIRQELKTRVIQGKSDAFVYYSGHGAPNVDNGQPHLLPWDYDPRYAPTPDSAYPLKELYADLGSLKARNVVVVVDACFAGQSEAGPVMKDVSPPYITVENPAANLPDGVVIAATGPREVATWYREAQHGLLTYYFLRALRGEQETGQARITPAVLEKYLKENVPQKAQELRGRNQNPQVFASNLDRILVELPISAVKTGDATIVPKYGSLEITIDVGGDLWIGGIHEAMLEPGQAFSRSRILAGPYQVEVRKGGYRTIQDQIVVLPDTATKKLYQLAADLPETPRSERFYGLIQVSVDVGGALYIDDRKVAELSPFERYTTARIEAGPHRVRVEKQGFETGGKEVLLRPNETASVEMALRRTGGPFIAVEPPAGGVRPIPSSLPTTLSPPANADRLYLPADQPPTGAPPASTGMDTASSLKPLPTEWLNLAQTGSLRFPYIFRQVSVDRLGNVRSSDATRSHGQAFFAAIRSCRTQIYSENIFTYTEVPFPIMARYFNNLSKVGTKFFLIITIGQESSGWGVSASILPIGLINSEVDFFEMQKNPLWKGTLSGLHPNEIDLALQRMASYLVACNK